MGGKIIIVLLILFGCNPGDELEPIVKDDNSLSELYQVLQSDLFQPEGFLVQIKFSMTKEGEPNHFSDFYYNQTGDLVLMVRRSAVADTVGLSIFKYDGSGNREKSINFIRQDGKTVWDSSMESVYNSNNQEIEIYSINANGHKQLNREKFYNDKKPPDRDQV